MKVPLSKCIGPVVALAVFALPVSLPAEDPKPAAENRQPPPIPAGLLADEHVREEAAVNEFTAPSIAKILETLDQLAPLPVNEVPRHKPEAPPKVRSDLAIALGFLIADGFFIVQAGEMGKIEPFSIELSTYIKGLGTRADRVTRHSAAILEAAKKSDVETIKKELTATQKDVEDELVHLRDADLAHLISLGGWIRAFQVASVAVDKNFTVDRAKIIMREDIADYYEYCVGSLHPSIADRPNFIQIRDYLAGLRTEMTLKPGKEPEKEQVAAIRKVAGELANLALKP